MADKTVEEVLFFWVSDFTFYKSGLYYVIMDIFCKIIKTVRRKQ